MWASSKARLQRSVYSHWRRILHQWVLRPKTKLKVDAAVPKPRDNHGGCGCRENSFIVFYRSQDYFPSCLNIFLIGDPNRYFYPDAGGQCEISNSFLGESLVRHDDCLIVKRCQHGGTQFHFRSPTHADHRSRSNRLS